MKAIGRYQGQLLDLSSRRSIQIIEPAGRAMDWQQANCLIRDFYHAGRFWVAVVPLDGVAEVYGQAFNFSRPRVRRNPNGYEIVYDEAGMPKRMFGMLNHVQSRFVMRQGYPIRLYESNQNLDDSPADVIYDFIYSIEAVGPKNVKFNFRDSVGGHLVCAHRFLSTQEMVFERIVLEGQYVTESPGLELAAEQKRQLLALSLQRSSDAGASEPYYLCRVCGTNNCTSNPFQILDKVVQYTWRQRLASLVYRLPIHPRLYLRIRGLDVDPTHRKLVRDEFADFIAAPATRQRKRAFLKQRKMARKAPPQ